jgi:hypothetical protein
VGISFKDTERPQRGDLVRWISDYNFYAADSVGNAWPHDPIYEYGIVMDVSDNDPWSVAVYCTSQGFWFTAQILDDDIEILSAAQRKLIVPTPEEVKKYEK